MQLLADTLWGKRIRKLSKGRKNVMLLETQREAAKLEIMREFYNRQTPNASSDGPEMLEVPDWQDPTKGGDDKPDTPETPETASWVDTDTPSSTNYISANVKPKQWWHTMERSKALLQSLERKELSSLN